MTEQTRTASFLDSPEGLAVRAIARTATHALVADRVLAEDAGPDAYRAILRGLVQQDLEEGGPVGMAYVRSLEGASARAMAQPPVDAPSFDAVVHGAQEPAADPSALPAFLLA